MEIAVLGGGHGSFATVAALSENGHRVRFWQRHRQSHELLKRRGAIRLTDYRGERRVPVSLISHDLAEVVSGAKLIVIPLPATSHEFLAKKTAPHLSDGQVIFLPPGTFGSFVFARVIAETRTNLQISIAETGTLPYLARKHDSDHVVVSVYAKRLPTGVFPAKNSGGALQVIREAFPVIEPCENALSAALMNAGSIIHPPLIIMNAGPLEHFPHWDIHNEGTQPSIRRVTDALDAERIAVREALGYGPPHFPLADHYSPSGEEWMYGRGAHDRLTDSGDWREFIDLEQHRYMLEDTHLGLSLLSSLGRWIGVQTPLASGFLSIGGAILGRDFYAEGRTLESLQLAHLTPSEMAHLLQQGIKP